MKYQKTVKVENIFLLVEFDSETEKFTFEKFYQKSEIPKEEKPKEEKPKEEKPKKVKSDFFSFDEEG